MEGILATAGAGRQFGSMISQEIGERYLIEEELGRGGTAFVYRARDRVKGGTVAIKILRSDVLSEISAERFLREVRLTARLQHPHIVPILDSGEYDGRPYCALPYMDGGTLRARLDKEKQLPLAEVIEIGVTVGRALDYAHKQGFLHRDVKPENILFSDGQARLADFGIARALDRSFNETSTSTGIIRGTPAYMSPEQVSGDRDYDGRTDIYSLACVLYEAIAGIAAFHGPNSQVVIAQRLMHAPRSVRVYRPTVPVELEQVLEKATALNPADRYATAGEFATAIERTANAHTTAATSVRPAPSASRLVWFVGATALLAATAVVATIAVKRGVGASAAPDTTRIVILPFANGASSEVAGSDLLYEGLRRWRGISLVESFSVADVIRQRGPVNSLDDARSVAGKLGAGRFVRAEARNLGASWNVEASLYDTQRTTPLKTTTLPLPADPKQQLAMYAALADSLILRGATGFKPAAGRTISIGATQVIIGGRKALESWDLVTADSLFGAALKFDSADARANLWLAQVRSWRDQPSDRWAGAIALAAKDSSALTPAEGLQARALAALASADYEKACSLYDRIATRSPEEFLGWYGKGDCIRQDRLVVQSSSSPSGWRFRSSYEQAMRAYRKAFEVMPSSYRGLQARAFEPLRRLLFTDATQRHAGRRAGEVRYDFQATPTLDHDTLVLVPYPEATAQSGASSAIDKVRHRQAVSYDRELLFQLVSRWNAELPDASGTKEAVAVSLQLLGNASAADSFAAARAVAKDNDVRLRLAAEEAETRLYHAVAAAPQLIESARKLTDSILTANPTPTKDAAAWLAPLAALLGECDRSASLSRAATAGAGALDVPLPVHDVAVGASSRIAAGCRTPLPAVAAELVAAGRPVKIADLTEYSEVGAATALAYPEDPNRIRRLAKATNDYILVAQSALLAGRADSARARLQPLRASRSAALPGQFPIDAALVEARLWVALGDSAFARELLDRSIQGLQFTPPLSNGNVGLNILRAGTVPAAVELRRSLSRDTADRTHWTSVLSAIWRGADAELRRRRE